jgi:hypothetical protein
MVEYEPPQPQHTKVTTVNGWTIGLLWGPWGASMLLLSFFYLSASFQYTTEKIYG